MASFQSVFQFLVDSVRDSGGIACFVLCYRGVYIQNDVAVLDIGPPVEDQERNVIDMGDGRFPRCGVFGELQVQNSSGIGIVDIDRGRALVGDKVSQGIAHQTRPGRAVIQRDGAGFQWLRDMRVAT